MRSVYFRRPEVKKQNGKLTLGEVNFLRSELWFSLEGLYKILDNAFWLNKTEDIRRAENKIFQLLLAKEIGFEIPASIITNHPSSAFTFYSNHNHSCVIKPIKSGLVESNQEEGVIFTSKLELDTDNVSRIKDCPVYLQHLVEKKADIRITIVGSAIFAAKIHSQENTESIIDWRKSIIPLKYSIFKLPREIIDKCLELSKRLHLNFGAIDMILDTDDKLIFLEINPNGQWAWIERQLNFPIAETITNLLIEKAN